MRSASAETRLFGIGELQDDDAGLLVQGDRQVAREYVNRAHHGIVGAAIGGFLGQSQAVGHEPSGILKPFCNRTRFLEQLRIHLLDADFPDHRAVQIIAAQDACFGTQAPVRHPRRRYW